MSLPLVLRPGAEADIAAVRYYLDQAQPGLGDRFAARLRDVLRQIEAMPRMYAVVWKTVRAVKVRKFPHVVYYRALDDRVEVLAVIHGAMQPSVWQSRV